MKKLIAANKWWLLSAAWIYTLTFVFNHYWSKSSSYEAIAHSFSQRIDKQLDHFNTFCNDTATVRKLADFELDSTRPVTIGEDIFYYIFSDSPDGMLLQYWSSAAIVPAPDDVPYQDTVKKVTYPSGTYILASRRLPNSLLTAVPAYPYQAGIFCAKRKPQNRICRLSRPGKACGHQ